MEWAKYGAWGAAGVLLGLAIAMWSQPSTNGGVGLALFIGLLFGIIARGLLRWMGVIKGNEGR